jgi:hypothetical protein
MHWFCLLLKRFVQLNRHDGPDRTARVSKRRGLVKKLHTHWHDSEIEIWWIPAVLEEGGCQDRQAQKSGDVQHPCGRRKA